MELHFDSHLSLVFQVVPGDQGRGRPKPTCSSQANTRKPREVRLDCGHKTIKSWNWVAAPQPPGVNVLHFITATRRLTEKTEKWDELRRCGHLRDTPTLPAGHNTIDLSRQLVQVHNFPSKAGHQRIISQL